MKKILITGENSFIGKSFIRWVNIHKSQEIELKQLSVRGIEWKNHDFSIYDGIIHLAGIAHVSTDKKMKSEYYKVNTDLTIEVAKKAKKSGVKQFIFMSSMIVYGSVENGKIDINTLPNPVDFYGDSKLQAEKGIQFLNDDKFKVAIIRPPMIYGKESRGNYNKLSLYAKKIPFFPKFINKRSMLYIENLNLFLYHIILKQEYGLFFPQNADYTCTSDLVKNIATYNNRRMVLISIFNPVIPVFTKINIFNKVFGDLYYDKSLSQYSFEYQLVSLLDSIAKTEGSNE